MLDFKGMRFSDQWDLVCVRRYDDKDDKTFDFLLIAKRGIISATRFFDKDTRRNGDPRMVTMEKSGGAAVQFFV